VATTDLDEKYVNSNLSLSADIRNYSGKPKADITIRATLYDSGKQIIKTLTTEKFSVLPESGQTVRLTGIITNPDKWSAEHPNLYKLTFELVNSSGKTEEVISAELDSRRQKSGTRCFTLMVNP
jgi:beta-galactosidase